MRNYEREMQAIIFRGPSEHGGRGWNIVLPSPSFHTFTGFLSWSSLSSFGLSMLNLSLSSHTYIFTLLIRLASHSLRHCWPMPVTKERLCWCLKKADKWFPSHRKASLDWEAKEQKRQFTLIGRMQERAIKKPVRKKQVVLSSPLPHKTVNTLEKTCLLRPRRYVCHASQCSSRMLQSELSSLPLLGLSCPQPFLHPTLAALTSLWFLVPAKHIPTPEFCTSCSLSETL